MTGVYSRSHKICCSLRQMSKICSLSSGTDTADSPIEAVSLPLDAADTERTGVFSEATLKLLIRAPPVLDFTGDRNPLPPLKALAGRAGCPLLLPGVAVDPPILFGIRDIPGFVVIVSTSFGSCGSGADNANTIRRATSSRASCNLALSVVVSVVFSFSASTSLPALDSSFLSSPSPSPSPSFSLFSVASASSFLREEELFPTVSCESSSANSRALITLPAAVVDRYSNASFASCIRCSKLDIRRSNTLSSFIANLKA